MNFPYKILIRIVNLLCFPLHIVVLLFLFIYKCCVRLAAKAFQDFEEVIPGENCFFLADNIWENPHSSIVSVMDVEGICTTETVADAYQKVYETTTNSGERGYRQLGFYPVRYYGFGFWKKCPNFKTSDRVHMLNQDDLTLKDEPLTSIVERMLRQPYKKEDPVWDIFLLPNYNGKPHRTLLFFRFHHLLADGMSTVKLMYALFGQRTLPETAVKPGASLSSWNKMSKNVVAKICTALTVLTTGFGDYVDDWLISKDRNGINYNSKGKIRFSGKWICSMGKKVEVQKLKTASKGYNCSITHILLAAMSSALENYFRKYHGDEDIPTVAHIVGSIPVPNHPDLKLVNRWAATRAAAKFNIPKVSDRIEYFKGEWSRALSSTLPLISAFVIRYVCEFLPTQVVNILSKPSASGTIVMSNMVGPNSLVTIGGGTVVDMFFWLPIVSESIAISVGIISYNGGVHLCLVGDTGSVPDRSRLDDLGLMMHDEIQEICKPFL